MSYRSGRRSLGLDDVADTLLGLPFRVVDSAYGRRCTNGHGLPLDDFEDKGLCSAVKAICDRDLNRDELCDLAGYELHHKRRRFVMEALRRKARKSTDGWKVLLLAKEENEASAVALAKRQNDFWEVVDLLRFECDGRKRERVIDALHDRLVALTTDPGIPRPEPDRDEDKD